jgi:mono/diheme cytochrome c family protein
MAPLGENRMPSRSLILIAGLVAGSATASASPPDGLAIYTKRCAGCHGDDGKAKTREGKKFRIADFTAAGWSKDWPLADIEKNAREGIKDKMPSFADTLTAAEIHAAAQHVLELATGAKDAPAASGAATAPR